MSCEREHDRRSIREETWQLSAGKTRSQSAAAQPALTLCLGDGCWAAWGGVHTQEPASPAPCPPLALHEGPAGGPVQREETQSVGNAG